MSKKELKDMSQEELVLDYLKRHKSGITSRIAVDELGIIQLPKRIFLLRNRGFNIEGVPMKGKSRFGKDVWYTRYTLSQK